MHVVCRGAQGAVSGLRRLKAVLLLIALAAAPCAGKVFRGPAGDISLESRAFGAAEYVPLLDLAKALGLQISWLYEARILELRGSGLTLNMMPGSRTALVDTRTVLQMDAAVVFSRGVPFVPATLLTKTLKPYYGTLRATAKTGSSTGVVVLDPGHGGRDPGTAHHSVIEKELVLDVTRRVREQLVAKGIKVRMTRETDVYVPLERRAEIANELGAVLFVSIHANAAINDQRTTGGSETFYLSRAQSASDAATERLENSPIKDDVHRSWGSLTTRLKRMLLGNHLKQTRSTSISLAQRVQARVGAVAVGDNRGIKPANLQVLRETLCPACLVELGFVTNPTDASYLRKSWYRQKLANAIAQGILDHLNTL